MSEREGGEEGRGEGREGKGKEGEREGVGERERGEGRAVVLQPLDCEWYWREREGCGIATTSL